MIVPSISLAVAVIVTCASTFAVESTIKSKVGALLSITFSVESAEEPVNPRLSVAIAFTLWLPNVVTHFIEYGAFATIPIDALSTKNSTCVMVPSLSSADAVNVTSSPEIAVLGELMVTIGNWLFSTRIESSLDVPF